MDITTIIEQLPPLAAFPSSAPRYPNLWVLVDTDFSDSNKPYSRFQGHRRAYELVWECLQRSADLVDDYEIYHTAEGCDGVARRRGLQYVEMGEESHDHSLHVRFYTQTVDKLIVKLEGHTYYAVPASVHYEVDRPGELHPYIDGCEVCGCTGQFTPYYDSTQHNCASEVKNIFSHDPLGVEVALYGSAQGKPVPLLCGLDSLAEIFDLTLVVAPKSKLRADMSTGNLGVVIINGLRPV